MSEASLFFSGATLFVLAMIWVFGIDGGYEMKKLQWSPPGIALPRCDLWSAEDSDEVISQSDFGEAVWEGIDEAERYGEEAPETLTVRGFARKPLGNTHALRHIWILERILGELDEDFGDTVTLESTIPTPAMQQACEAFTNVIRREYRVWQCDCVVEVEVPVAEWRRIHEAA